MLNRKRVFFLIIFFIDFLYSMDLPKNSVCEMTNLPQDIARNCIQFFLSFQDVARLKRASQWCDTLYSLEQLCYVPDEPDRSGDKSPCSRYGCCKLSHNYYTCTKALSHFASTNNKRMFNHLWSYHAALRSSKVSEILKKTVTTVDENMRVYRKYYSNSYKVDKRFLDDVVNALQDPDTQRIYEILSESNVSITDLVHRSTRKKLFFSVEFNLDFIFNKACAFNDSKLVCLLCAGHVDAESFQCIVRNAHGNLLLDLINIGMLSVDSMDRSGKSLLHYAAEDGLDSLIEKLCETKISLNNKDFHGRTPLHYAVKRAELIAVLTLLATNDVDVWCVDKKGKTTLDYVFYTKKFAPDNPEEITDRKMIGEILKGYITQKGLQPYNYSNDPKGWKKYQKNRYKSVKYI